MRPFKLLPLLLLLATAVFAANWAGEVTTPTTTETIDGKKCYVITNAAELAGFAEMVNAGDTAANAVLDHDIVVNEGEVTTSSQKWTQIGNGRCENEYFCSANGPAFSGTFDGKGYSVSGIYAADTTSGLFGYVGKHGIVKNLTLKKSLLSGRQGVGLVGENGGMLNNLTSRNNNYSNVGSNESFSPSFGGIAGINYGTIDKCANVDTLFFSNPQDIKISLGGIVGENVGTISNCVNTGTLSVSSLLGYFIFGGIVGHNLGTIIKCGNYGILLALRGAAFVCMGGIVGMAHLSFIENSYSFNDSLSGKGIVGGLIGCAYSGSIRDVYAVTTTISGSTAGGLIGYDFLKVQMAYYNSAVTGVTSAVGVDSSKVAPEYMGSLTTAQMQTDEFAWWLNTTHGDSANGGVWSRGKGYPVFADSVHLATHRVVFISGGVTLSTVYSDSTGTIAWPSNPASSSGSFIGWIYDTTSILETGSKITRDIVASPLFATAAPVKVTFQDADGTAIVSRFVNKDGTVLLPADPAAASGTFFVGWFKADESQLTATSVITANTTVHAVYKDISEGYLIVFKNYDGTVLDSHYVLTNVFPAYKGAAPVKAATARCTYKFNGWTPAIAAATAGATYTAVFDSTVNRYRIVFLQAAGDTLQKDSVAYGETPVYSGTTPVKASTATYEYTFSTWSPAVSSEIGRASCR